MFFIFDVAPFIGYTITQKILIYAIAGGVFLAFFAYWFVQTFIGGLVRKLLERGVGEKNGATLKELGKDKLIYKWFLRNGSTLRNLVSCDVGELKELNKMSSEDGEEVKSKASYTDESAKDDITKNVLADGEAITVDNEEAAKGEASADSEAADSEEAVSVNAKAKKLSFKERVKNFFYRFRLRIYDYENVKFFIPAENKKKAIDRHSKTVSPYWLPIMLVICGLCAFGMTYLLPIIMDFIRN